MKNFYFVFVFLFFISDGFCQTSSLKEKYNSIDNIMMDVRFLSSDFLEGRETGSKGEKLAAEYIHNRMDVLGLRVFYHEFDIIFHGQKTSSRGRNVIGYLDNNYNNTIVLGAHYDHLGYGNFGSRRPNAKTIHNGADDNASGVALILELIKYLKKDSLKSNILVVAFSGEELGLLGSDAFVNEVLVDSFNIKYMMNFDMVGKLKNNKLILNGTGTSNWIEIIQKTKSRNNKNILELKEISSGVGPSDYTSFYKKDIPVLSFFTGAHDDYHTPDDDASKLNYYGIFKILLFARSIIQEADDINMRFIKTKNNSSSDTPKFSVTLGVMPSYSFDGEGMKIDVVIENRPASLAGIKDGDIVIKIGPYKVKDLNTYMLALSKFKKGEPADVLILRGSIKKRFKVIF